MDPVWKEYRKLDDLSELKLLLQQSYFTLKKKEKTSSSFWKNPDGQLFFLFCLTNNIVE